MNWLRQHTGLVALLAVLVLLPVGMWAPGLWDPWEMNRAFVARRMAEAPVVLVAEGKAQSDPTSIAAALSQAGGDAYTVVSTADFGSTAGALDRARTNVSDHVYPAVVIDLDARVKGPSDAEGLKAVSDFLKTAVPQNLSTSFILVSSSGTNDPTAVKEAAVRSAADQGDAVERATRAVATVAALPEALDHELSGDWFLAQFKSSGRTVFAPPLYPFLVSLSFRAFGHQEASARLAGVLLAALTAVVVFFFVRRFLGERYVALSMVVLATSPLFSLSARFVENGHAVMFFLSLGCLALGGLLFEQRIKVFLPVLLLAQLGLYLSGGMLAQVTLVLIVAVFPVISETSRRTAVLALVSVTALGVLLAGLTFLPDSAFFRQFRFTAVTFAGGMRSDARSFDFVFQELGFGMFPWSILLPVALVAAVGRAGGLRPERLLVLLWAIVPIGVLLVAVRPLYHTLYVGVPALAALVAVFVAELEDEPVDWRVLAFIGVGLFAVMFKDILQSSAPLVSYLTTDPMFSEPGKGDIVFPPVKLPAIGVLCSVVVLLMVLLNGARLVSFIRALPATLAQGKVFKWVMVAMAGLIALDIAIFLGLKWAIVSGEAGPEAAVGPVLLRIFLTGPDIAALYAVTLLFVLARYGGSVGRRLRAAIGETRLATFSGWLLALELPRAFRVGLGGGAAGIALVLVFGVFPEVSYHLSQKHIIETYKESAAIAPGDLFRHGVFGGRGTEDSNFYTAGIPEMSSRSDVIARLKDQSRRTFFIVPKTQWSELNSAFRQAAGGRFPPVLDDRSSRFILVASSLAPSETDRNWLKAATITQSEFDALTDVTRETVDFDGKVQFVGYWLDSNAVRRGGKAVLKTYFKCTDKVPVSYRMFMHIDRQGSSSRIHGDHWILNLVKETEEQTSCVGCYATTHWLKGDIIVDTYEIEVPIGSPSGPHDIWMGFYNPSDDKRLPVKDYDKTKIRHDGQNRVRIGVLTVE